MIAPTRYFDLVREMKNAYNHRLRLVESAKQRGIKPTAQLFATTVPTVRKWLRRYQQRGPSGLQERSRARHQQSQKTSAALEAQLVELRKTLPTFGARRLIREFDLPISHGALEHIWRQQGLMPKRRRKYQRKQDLAHIKAQWAVFQQISADTKDLDDIPHYWAQAQRLGLPIVQYTARDVRSGLLFWSFAEKRSAAASAVFASRIQQHLDRYGVSLRDLVWQTDNGGEFKGDFPKALGTASMCASPRPPTPTRATSKPCTASKKTSSLIWSRSPAVETSSPRSTPTSSTSTWRGPTHTKNFKLPGRSLSGLLLAHRCNSACFHRSSWITTSRTMGDTMCLGFPNSKIGRGSPA
jgi:transposase